MTHEDARQLDEAGGVGLPGAMDVAFLEEIRAAVERLWEEEGENAGSEFRQEPGARRLANLVDKGEVFERVVSHPRVLAAVERVIGSDFKLSSLNARSTDPWWPECQPLHCDVGALADDSGFWVCNTIWLLDDFTPENGATRIVPASQRLRQLPQQALADPQAAHPDEVLVLGSAGDVVVMNARTPVARGHGESHRPSAPRAACVLHARRQAAAAIPEGAAAPGNAGAPLAGIAAHPRARRCA